MIIVSEITGGQYKTIEDCLNAENEYLAEQERLKKETERKEKQKQFEDELAQRYQCLFDAWCDYIDFLNKHDYEVDNVESKAILFCEVILDDEARKASNYASQA